MPESEFTLLICSSPYPPSGNDLKAATEKSREFTYTDNGWSLHLFQLNSVLANQIQRLTKTNCSSVLNDPRLLDAQVNRGGSSIAGRKGMIEKSETQGANKGFILFTSSPIHNVIAKCRHIQPHNKRLTIFTVPVPTNGKLERMRDALPGIWKNAELEMWPRRAESAESRKKKTAWGGDR